MWNKNLTLSPCLVFIQSFIHVYIFIMLNLTILIIIFYFCLSHFYVIYALVLLDIIAMNSFQVCVIDAL
jgi:hypothetical protein